MAHNKIEEILNDCSKTFLEREKVYGEAYRKNGDVLSAMFPNGLSLTTPNDFARFAALNWIVGKLNRYSTSFESGGHVDSSIDLVNYSAILTNLTIEAKDAN